MPLMPWSWWAALAATVYFAFTHSGPFALLCDLQEEAWGWYFGELSAIGVWVAVGLPLELLRRLLPGAKEPAAEPPEPTPAAELPPDSFRRFVSDHVHLPIVAVVTLCVGSLALHKGISAGPLTATTVEDYEAGAPPSSSWVAVSGRVLVDSAVWDNKGSYYMPMVGASWKPGQPASVLVLAFDEADVERLRGRATVQGITRKALSAEARRTLADGPAPSVEDPWVLRLNDAPQRIINSGRGLLAVGLVAALATIVWWRIQINRVVLSVSDSARDAP